MPAARPLNRPSAPADAVVIPSAYEDLLRDVRSALFTGRVKIEYAWLMMFHDIGRLIHTHLLLNQDRAGYAAKTFSRLAADTGVSRRVLYEWVQFFRFFPIVRQSAQLTRTHYRLLCQVGDDKQRQVLTAQATKKKWTCPELQERVRALNAAASSDAMGSNGAGAASHSIKLLTPKRGIVGLYRVVARKRGLAVDVGFKEYLPLTAAQAREFADGDIVSMHGGRLAVVKTAKPADLFTYRALDHRVIDGDTLTLDIELPRSEMVEKFRLRGIDCPEMNTAEGKAAKRFVEGLMSDVREITVVTSKVDKYDRYLADVFLEGNFSLLPAASKPGKDGSALDSQPREAPIFLNNVLLENGHAVRMDESDRDDWSP